jgi:hypothetical protein
LWGITDEILPSVKAMVNPSVVYYTKILMEIFLCKSVGIDLKYLKKYIH